MSVDHYLISCLDGSREYSTETHCLLLEWENLGYENAGWSLGVTVEHGIFYYLVVSWIDLLLFFIVLILIVVVDSSHLCLLGCFWGWKIITAHIEYRISNINPFSEYLSV